MPTATQELAVFDGKGWGRRPVEVVVEDSAAVEPGLLLFAAFVVRGLAEDAGCRGRRRRNHGVLTASSSRFRC